ncbi:MAG: hypothetical protein FWF97_04765 [Alphaproteobacteria bacterium]|nr:hypothetical protein [Alphaproteobacteria bacterium]
MKKISVSVRCLPAIALATAGALCSVLCAPAARAAYPAYGAQTQIVPVQTYVQPQPAYQQPQYVPVTGNGRMTTAANPNRITGAVPQVGNSSVAAGRQYYQPSDYDRLADSGLYIGLSVGYAMSINGGIRADYQNQEKAFFAPGAWQRADFKHDTVLPLQLSVGAAINSDIRIDFSYSRYSGMSYPDHTQTGDGVGGYTPTQATGGNISSTATMLNVYYNLDSYTGYMAGGALKPYIGAGLGIATNTIADYLVYDPEFYGEDGIYEGVIYEPGTLTAISDIYAYHAGGTMEQLAYMLEGGLSTELEGGMKLDFFVRWTGLGKVQSSGSIVVSQTEWLSTGAAPIGTPGSEEPAPFDSVFHYTNWFESGTLGLLDVGVRMRIQF